MRIIRLAGPALLLAAIVFAGTGEPRMNALAGAPYNGFDICLRDESNGNLLVFNSTTGDYQFTSCASGLTLTGTGKITRKGCTVTLEVSGPDRRVLARAEICVKIGTAFVQTLSPSRSFSILDKNITNNICSCGMAT